MITARAEQQARQIGDVMPGQVIRIRCRFLKFDLGESVYDAIRYAIELAMALVPGWALNNVIFPIRNGERVCEIYLVRTA